MGGFLGRAIGAGASYLAGRGAQAQPGTNPYDLYGFDQMGQEAFGRLAPPVPPPDSKIAELQKRKVLRRPDDVPFQQPSPFGLAGGMQGGGPAPGEDVFAGQARAQVQPPVPVPSIAPPIAPPVIAAALAPPPPPPARVPEVSTTGLVGRLQSAEEVFPESPLEPGEKTRDVFIEEELDDEWRYGPLNDRKIRSEEHTLNSSHGYISYAV